MKVRIQFKDPDAAHDAIRDAVKALPRPEGVTAEEWEPICESRIDATDLSKWIEWGEYVTVEIDTETKTAVVLPVQR